MKRNDRTAKRGRDVSLKQYKDPIAKKTKSREHKLKWMALGGACLMIYCHIIIRTHITIELEDGVLDTIDKAITDEQGVDTKEQKSSIDTTTSFKQNAIALLPVTNGILDSETKMIQTIDHKCGDKIPVDQIPPFVFPLFEMVYGYNEGRRNTVGHISYNGPMRNGVKILLSMQVCSYTLLDRFWLLAKEYNITRWSAHGGSLMGAVCHRSINPWDDDIDITVASCDQLLKIHSKAGNVTERYPGISKSQYFWQRGKHKWDGRLIDDEYILIKGDAGPGGNWFKLKAVAQIISRPTRDLGGMDIQCLDDRVSKYEKEPMKRSGFRDALVKEGAELQVVEYGSTKIMMVPDSIARVYILDRYKKESFCDFPLDKTTPPLTADMYQSIGRVIPPTLPRRASHIEEVLSNWFISQKKRNDWISEIGTTLGNELNKEIPNMDHVEIDNSIASPQSCQIDTLPPNGQGELNVVGFNAGRGVHWAEFAEMIELMPELQKPDIVVLNEMDIGMARSGNIHTTRKLAFRLGMNYAWGLEFIELTNGSWEEQNQTKGMENALGLHGNAILSRCPMYDPMIYRDKLDERYFSNKKFTGNAHGAEKRLGGHMGLFVRSGQNLKKSASVNNDILSLGPNLIVGSVHKLKESTHREEIWEYLGFGSFPNITVDMKVKQVGITRYNNTIGVVASGDLESRGFCTESGLRNLDKPQKHRTFPADCEKQQLGLWRGDQFCGNMKVLNNDRSILPCYKAPISSQGDNAHNINGVQISDHSIIQISLSMPTSGG